MNSESTVSAKDPAAEAESVTEPSESVSDASAADLATSEPDESAAAQPPPKGHASNSEPASVESPEASDAPAAAPPVGPPATASDDTVQSQSAAETAAGDLSAPRTAESEGSTVQRDDNSSAPVTAEDEAGGGRRRKLRLNPALPDDAVKPVPSVRDGSAPPPAATPVPAAVDDTDEEHVEPGLATAPPPPAVPVDVPESDALDADMEAEIAAALNAGDAGTADVKLTTAVDEAAQSVGDDATPTSEDDVVEGAKLSGMIQSIHEDNVFLDFGLRQSGVVSKRQFGPKKEPKVGDKLEVVVTKVDEDEGLIVCSLPRGAARIAGDWNAVAVGQTVECMVTKTNKGGLEVSVSNLRGFMPASQVDIGYVSDLKPFVGQKLAARVTEVNPGRRRLVLSRRELLAEERAEAEAELLSQIEVGQTVSGRVKTIKDYGAFVDLGGVDGFLHIGQMSWVRIEHPQELLSEGQDVEVKILTIEPDKKDPERKRIGLGMRQLIANPWASAEDKFPKGSTQTGKVTRTEAYGAFVELEPGVEGLVHISELDHQRVKRVTEVLNVGQQTEVQVLEVDRKRKRISLSVKALTAAPEAATDEDLAPGQGQPYERKRQDNLKGGIGGDTPGGLFGNPNDFS